MWGLYFILLAVPALSADCNSTLVISSGQSTLVSRGAGVYTPAVFLTSDGWVKFPDAPWIWEANTWSIGTYVFSTIFDLKSSENFNITRATLYTAVDDTFDLLINGQLVAHSEWNAPGPLNSYDVMQYITTADSTKNVLQIAATNILGPGGLAFKLVVEFS